MRPSANILESASILSSKVELLVQMIPALGKEIEWDTRGKNTKTVVSKDKVSYQFKNGSVIENLAATESSRGQRYTSGIIEECAKIDGKILNAVVIPTMAVDRNINGQVDKNEKINRRQLYMDFLKIRVFTRRRVIENLLNCWKTFRA